MSNNKGNQDQGKHDKNAPKQNQSHSLIQEKGREDGHAKGSQEKPARPETNKGNDKRGK